MTNAAFKNKIAPGDRYFDPKVKAIRRTPDNEHLVSAGDLSTARGDKEPKSSNGDSRPCAMDCGIPALPDWFAVDTINLTKVAKMRIREQEGARSEAAP